MAGNVSKHESKLYQFYYIYLFFVSFQTDYIKCLIFDLISGIYICSLSINFKDFDDLMIYLPENRI